MSIWRRARPDLPVGAYDEVISDALEQQLAKLAATHAGEVVAIGRDADVDEHLVTMVRDAASIVIRGNKDAREKLAVAQRLLHQIASEGGFRDGETDLKPQLLKGIAARAFDGGVRKTAPPRGSLLSSGLITNARGESVLDHLASEFATADRISLLCSFIKLSGLDKFRPMIERHRALGRPLRVLTTTYMRATEAKAIELLQRLGAEVRISYDDSSTRLHAKAWIFHRDSEYSTAYVGSSNLSHSAQTEGLEWNLRIAQADQPDVVDDMASVFETYWNDGDKFEPFDGTDSARVRLTRALTEPDRGDDFVSFELEPKEWQKPVLRELEEVRALGRNKNLVVAATGTGKTLIAAFDYERLQRAGAVESLLFIAHRREILEQARRVFRHVLRRPDFGELWGDGHKPEVFRHVFAMIQTLRGAELPRDRFDHVIVDEVHHAAADTYDGTLERLEPKQLVGLTATPERADGRLYDKHFPRPYVGNLRVWDAIQQQVLVPFRYFVLDVDGLDLADARWDRGYVESDLSRRLITAAELWVRSIVRAVGEYVARPESVRALAFCVDKNHARVVADRLTRDVGLNARVLTDETPREERDRAKADLTSGRVHVLCVVDLFNEGIDIPDVNTLFLFRPTESATVFLQQIGRGLRRSREKDILTIFDVTGRQHPKFRFDRHLRELLGHTPRELREFVEKGFGRLPSGCVLRFEEQAQADVLERVRRAIPADVRGLRELLRAHADQTWTLERFLTETEVDLLDVYRDGRSWTALRAEVGLVPEPSESDAEALSRIPKLLHVTDELRLRVWDRLLSLEIPGSTLEQRAAGMLFAVLYGREASNIESAFARWSQEEQLREELRQLLPVLRARADRLPRSEPLEPDVPLLLHAEYLDIELSAAFHAVTQREGYYRHFYTGVETVANGRFDLLLVSLEKGDAHEHLKYQDFPLSETLFQWQSKAPTRQDDDDGRRHLQGHHEGITSLLLVRETKKDARGITRPFRYLGPVVPSDYRGERPITIEWSLRTPLRPEWVRRWSSVS
jgi:superfamily II DNA or RNA helicase/HKD family nuclease